MARAKKTTTETRRTKASVRSKKRNVPVVAPRRSAANVAVEKPAAPKTIVAKRSASSVKNTERSAAPKKKAVAVRKPAASAKKAVSENEASPRGTAAAGPAVDPASRNSNHSANKWSGNVIRVPALRKGEKTKLARSKRAQTEDGNPATEHDPIQFREESGPLPRTTLSEAHLREFKELLLEKRAELCGDVVRLTDEALNRKSDGQGDQSSMPIHMADLGTDNWEQEFTLGLIANEQAVVREIDQALERIVTKTYGTCLATHRPIGLARLRAKPWAKYCIEYARAREEGRAN